MSKVLDKRAKQVILDQIECLGEVTTETVMELVRPHYIFNSLVAREREIRRKANRIMAQFRDGQGTRTCFSYTDNSGQSKYVNIDKTFDIGALNGVSRQINNKLYGLTKASKKVNARLLELAGQTKLFEEGDTAY